MSAVPFWNDERDAQLRELHAQGLTGRKIGERLGVSHVSVGNRIRALGMELNGTVPASIKHGTRASAKEATQQPTPEFKGGAHVGAYKRARRGFEVPKDLETRYFDLLKSGVPIAEACRRLGITSNH